MQHLPRVLIDAVPTATFQRQEPAEELRPYVAFFWQSQPAAELRSFVLPNAQGVLSFNLGRQPWYSDAPPHPRRVFARSQVFGHLTRPCCCCYPAGTELFGVTLQPGALALLLGVPAPALADLAADLTALLPLASLEAELRREPAFAGRVALLQAWLRAQFRGAPVDYRYQLVQAAAARFGRPGAGQYVVEQAAAQVSVTPKSLTRYFQQVVGLGPKRCAQLARFKLALAAYRQYGSAWDYEAAGYADFAHFARSSHRLLGRGLAGL
ncbi:AraC family transcriptional regulator [Hymenobacter gummosus]|uniref:AraC family transcriptional regulator n=1 Tax=Hymenobacter gummosus TaxID=1776032 RepID=A0A431TWP4_9BACT|nr:AraC family transcriptional regulator [Hymenobacter gummosus]RTQ46014.1 AraC family transcriptional regulator [Hymenobacter gummosus]